MTKKQYQKWPFSTMAVGQTFKVEIVWGEFESLNYESVRLAIYRAEKKGMAFDWKKTYTHYFIKRIK